MNKISYTLTVAFIASITTLVLIFYLSENPFKKQDNQKLLPVITKAELEEHNSKESCWKEIYGKVYDITDYIAQHPTSPQVLLRWCGKESTEAWESIRSGRSHSQAALLMLEHFLVGTYQENE